MQPSSSRTSLSTIHAGGGGGGGGGPSNKNSGSVKLDEIISKMQLNCAEGMRGSNVNNNNGIIKFS